MSQRYDYLKQLINNIEDVEFGENGDQSLIDEAEQFFGTKLPDSYKWWLLNFDGGTIRNEEVYSLYPEGMDRDFSGGDLRHMYQLHSKKSGYDKNKIIIFEPSGWDEVFYFNLKSESDDGPIYISNPGFQYETKFAESFADFLIKILEDM